MDRIKTDFYSMRVTLLQTNIVWEDKQENLRLLREKLIKLRGEAEIVVLPETFYRFQYGQPEVG